MMHNQHRSPSGAQRKHSVAGNAAVSSAPLSRTLIGYIFTLLCVMVTFIFVTLLSHSSLSSPEIAGARGVPVQPVNKYSSQLSELVERAEQLVLHEEEMAFEAARSVGKKIGEWEHRVAQSPWLRDVHFSTLNYKRGFFGSVHPHARENATASTAGDKVDGAAADGAPHVARGIIAPTAISEAAAQLMAGHSPASNMKGAPNTAKVAQSTVSDSSASAIAAADAKMMLQCPHAELVSYWSPASAADRAWISPYASFGPQPKYVTFEPDVGGWNNIRMQMELVLVFAYTTGRTLVLPPDQPMYLLNKGKGHQNAHNFADFFPFEFIKTRLPVITMEEFLKTEALTGHLVNQTTKQVAYPPLLKAGEKMIYDATIREEKLMMWDYLRGVGVSPKFRSMKEFLVIPPHPGFDESLLPPKQRAVYERRQDIAGANRAAKYYNETLQMQKVIHFISKPGDGYRLLEHFYTFLHIQDPMVDRLMKRFVRDYVRYVDVIFCTGASIIHKLFQQGGGKYNSFHIRRGELQYKEVKIPAEQILENVGAYLAKDQIVYVATDEKNKTFFNAFKSHFKAVYFLNDFMESEHLKALNPNMLGMIDQVVCTRGQNFVGTWFSTFTGYITRLRGYLGYSDQTVFFGDKAHRDRYHFPELPKFPFYMREWNISWDNIDD